MHNAAAGSEVRVLRTGLKEKLAPFLLTLGIIIVDQITKSLVVAFIPPVQQSGYALPVFGDLLRIIHARNPGVAFSIGHALPDHLRVLLFTLLPVAVLGTLVVYYFRSRDLSALQRWSVAGIVGGGLGNLIDRALRPHGVVDFIDVKFFGLFGLERWPTFNVADASVVVCGVLLVITIFFDERKQDHE